MVSFTQSIENFVGAIFGIFRNLASSVLAVFTSILALVQTAAMSLLELARGFADFILSNILILSVIGVALVLYTATVQRNATPKAGIGASHGKKNIA
ncbi:hypothetical protein TWF696_003708 [Orbilia brochopaga]|uniref:Uncharacterized protein n=1 Tax=Orbilia brochopaga TaxID=3140254 RepID=A0AAV9V3W8_9PEZI